MYVYICSYCDLFRIRFFCVWEPFPPLQVHTLQLELEIMLIFITLMSIPIIINGTTVCAENFAFECSRSDRVSRWFAIKCTNFLLYSWCFSKRSNIVHKQFLFVGRQWQWTCKKTDYWKWMENVPRICFNFELRSLFWLLHKGEKNYSSLHWLLIGFVSVRTTYIDGIHPSLKTIHLRPIHNLVTCRNTH